MIFRGRYLFGLYCPGEPRNGLVYDKKHHNKAFQYSYIIQPDTELSDPEVFDSIADLYIPLGFCDYKEMLIPVSRIILKWAVSEHLAMFSNPGRDPALKNLVLLLAFWLKHPLMADSFFCQNTIESIFMFMKSGRLFIDSARFAKALKAIGVTPVLINITKDERVPSQIKTRILKIIKMLSAEGYVDSFAPKDAYRPGSKRQENTHSTNAAQKKLNTGRSEVHGQYRFGDEDHEDFIKKIKFDNQSGQGASSSKGFQMEVSRRNGDYHGVSPHSMPNELDERRRQAGSRNGMNKGMHVEKLILNGANDGQQFSFGQRKGYGEANIMHSYLNNDDQTIEGKKKQHTFDQYSANYGGGDPQESLYLEYVSLIDSHNTKELQSFAVQNLSQIIEHCVFGIMQNKPVYLKLLSLIDLNMGPEDREHQKKILLCMAKHLTEDRASDAIGENIIERVLKAFNRSGHDFHEVFAALIFAHIVKSNYNIRVNGMVEMLKTPYIKLQDLSLKILKDISKPSNELKRDYTVEFENHLRFLLEASLSKDRSLGQVNGLIEILANLCINDYLCPEIIHHSGIETLLLHLREKANVEGQRLAARGLLNLGAKSRENKLRIVSELNYEIKAMHKNELDTVVRSYISTLMQAKGAGVSEKYEHE